MVCIKQTEKKTVFVMLHLCRHSEFDVSGCFLLQFHFQR